MEPSSDFSSYSSSESDTTLSRVYSSVIVSRRVSSFGSVVSREQQRITKLWRKVVSMESDLCDVKIGVKNSNGERVWIGANKSRLKEQSTFFEAVWKDPTGMEETCQELELDGITEQAMGAIIAVSFGQFDFVTVDKRTLAQYLYASLKYGVQILLECCKETAEGWTSVHALDPRFDDCFSVIVDLHRLGMTEYASELIDKMKIFQSTKRITHVFRSEAVLDIPFDMLVSIIKQDSLNLEENEIWKRCIEWASAQCENNDEGLISDDDDDSSSLMGIDEYIHAHNCTDAASVTATASATDTDTATVHTEPDSEMKTNPSPSASSAGVFDLLTEEKKESDSDTEDEITVASLLRRLKPFIRFTRMSFSELADLSGWESVLSKEEQLKIYQAKSGLDTFLFCNVKPRVTLPKPRVSKVKDRPSKRHTSPVYPAIRPDYMSPYLRPINASRFRSSMDKPVRPQRSRRTQQGGLVAHYPAHRSSEDRRRHPSSGIHRRRRVEERRNNYLNSMRDPPSVW